MQHSSAAVMTLLGLAAMSLLAAGAPPAAASAITTVYSFGKKGNGPLNPTFPLAALKGRLYAPTMFGGDHGTIYSVSPSRGTGNEIYKFPKTSYPVSELTVLGDALYGTSYLQNEQGGSTIYKVDRMTHKTGTVYTFQSGTGVDGFAPYGGVTVLGSLLYGTTAYGGALNSGTIYSFDPATNVETILYTQGSEATDGNNPEAHLLASNGVLYGTANSGGALGGGTIFSFDPATAQEVTIHAFGK